MSDAALVFRLLALSQILLLGVAIASLRRPGRVWLIMLGLGLAAYFAVPILPTHTDAAASLAIALVMLSNAIPLALWFSVRMLFEDDASAHLPALALGGAYLAVVLWEHTVVAPESGFSAIGVLPQLVKLGFAIAAVALCLRGREADLVAPRRRARRWVASALGLIVATVIVTELATAWQVPTVIEASAMAVFFAMLLGVNLLLIRTPITAALYPATAPVPAPQAARDPLVMRLEQLMRDQRAYANPELRISGLAAQLGVGEHTLRRTINGTLGQRNFNRYINAYRIDEAGRRLVEEARLPVLSIALDVGFRSLSAFNAAFRDVHGTTPTAFRAARLMDSERT